MDVIIHLDRPGGNMAPTIRCMKALSRFEATPPEIYVELTPTGYVVLGDASDIVRMQVASALADALPATEETAKPITDWKHKGEDGKDITEPGILAALAEAGIRAARSTVDEELKRWCEAGYARQTGGGKRGSPYRYWLTARPPVAFSRLKPCPPSEERNTVSPGPIRDCETVSSGANLPSDERNTRSIPFDSGEPAPDAVLEPFLSSDAHDGYGGRNKTDHTDDVDILWYEDEEEGDEVQK